MSAVAAAQNQLQDVDVSRLTDGSLHEFVDELQIRLAEIHHQIESGWFVPAPVRIAG